MCNIFSAFSYNQCTLTPTEMRKLIKELRQQAQELLDLGDSREKAEGYGMQRVLDVWAKNVPRKPKSNVQPEVWIGRIPEIYGYGLSVMEHSEAEAMKTLKREFLKMKKSWQGVKTFPQAMDYFGGRVFKIESGKAYYDDFGE